MDNIPIGALISMTYRSNFVMVNTKMKELGLSAGQFFVLMVLSHDQGITQDTLAWRLLIDKGSIARAVKILEDKGFIRRITDESNRRAVLIYLTETGEQLIPEVLKIDQELEETTLSGLTEEERTHAKVLLHKMAQNSYEAAYGKNDKKWKEFPLKSCNMVQIQLEKD
ncbi:MarR family winged helix-turn-helix transcriptional regulator [Methanococcoides alaskense]|uniref:DNA-binding MarR family transcriptional regulator n=1 Tax=Methanococcoides alaskense TaxID=325778 RepID=A0AA90U0T9_9EURY|nr:MarR family transcriptional regulator [Methanococcoides alaskense]MDA0524279.1 MarR family transcriptional regulator [Methanococcoides alaskense]MDR6223770.1 DNA-binding MarR family transcriptional regulator [Methanococcoides alaskense]